MESLCLLAQVDELESARSFVLERMERWDLAPTLVPKVELVLEEVLTNVVKYAYPDAGGKMEVTCSLEGTTFRLVLQDWGNPFNPLAKDPPTLSSDIIERPIGGLGIFLVQHMVDHVAYERVDDRNVLTLEFIVG
jgi:serine/threonine-protein kinase RsbW